MPSNTKFNIMKFTEKLVVKFSQKGFQRFRLIGRIVGLKICSKIIAFSCFFFFFYNTIFHNNLMIPNIAVLVPQS